MERRANVRSTIHRLGSTGAASRRFPIMQMKLGALSSVLDVVGVVEQHGWPGAQAQGHNVPILSRPFAVIAKGITSEIEQVPEKRQAPRSRRPPPAKLGTEFRMGRGRVFAPDGHVTNLNWIDRLPICRLADKSLSLASRLAYDLFRVRGRPA